ncbi:hypothetical protein [Aureivirga sp. CE67]|uniref:hypothetical protein n=1 Tax=Aureivirga sp. CE67 TaxID=1788983 RepID=UPI0018C8EE2C|nr:hypothetical protein [Aureivirga sp. CE67]
MKFNLDTNELFTDEMKLIKKLACPYHLDEDHFEDSDSFSKKCLICEKKVLDTENFSDKALEDLIKKNPETCLSIDLNQKNVTIIANTTKQKI